MTILNLGRLGDNINLLPVAYANKGTTFVTSEKYSSVFEGTSYCQTKKYSGDPVELQHCINIPWRVVLNECIDLAKEFGGTDGHKYVNAVLNQLAPQLRATEVEADRKTPSVDLPTAATE